MHTDLFSVYASIAAWPISRPMPDCLKPPNGIDGSSRLWAFTHTVPALILGTRSMTWRRSLDQMLAPSP
ncbi:hypothetical protein PA6761_06084 [Pseudomonas aeruginosa]